VHSAGYDNIFKKRGNKAEAAPAAAKVAEAAPAVITHNTYYDNKVQSLAFQRQPGGGGGNSKTSIGIIAPGSYHFGTDAPERMTVVSGACDVQIDGTTEWVTYAQGSSFNIAGKHGFNIRVSGAATAYLCEYL
jgi:uncharacterized protein YaiE (UPF0345 family)